MVLERGAAGGYDTRCGHHRRCKPLKRQHRRDGNAAQARYGARHGLHRPDAERATGLAWLGLAEYYCIAASASTPNYFCLLFGSLLQFANSLRCLGLDSAKCFYIVFM